MKCKFIRLEEIKELISDNKEMLETIVTFMTSSEFNEIADAIIDAEEDLMVFNDNR